MFIKPTVYKLLYSLSFLFTNKAVLFHLSENPAKCYALLTTLTQDLPAPLLTITTNNLHTDENHDG